MFTSQLFQDTHHYLLPLADKFRALEQNDADEMKRMQAILEIADETVKDTVARNAARSALFEDVSNAAVTARNIGISDNSMRLRDDEPNILFSPQLSDPHEVARTDIDSQLQKAVKDLRGIAKDAPIAGVSSTHQRVAPLRSAMSVALKERDPGSLRALSQHSNPRTQNKLKNLKAAAVLYDNLGRIQREQLEPIEKKMIESPFVLPFHVPFVIVSNLIRNELLAHHTGEHIEEEFDDFFNASERELERAYRGLDPDSAEKDGAPPSAKECFITLSEEKEARAERHAHCVALLEKAKEIEREGREFLAPTVSRCREQAMASLDDIATKSEHLRTLARDARERLEASLARRVAAKELDISECAAKVQQLEQRAFQNRVRQEKSVRRMREEIKGLVKLQQEHCQIVHDLGKVQARKVENEVLLEGVRLACATRCDRLQVAEQSCNHSSALSLQVKKQLEAALAECQHHISRVTSQEFSRCSRIGQRTVKNCAQWYRCLGDLLAIRSSRLNKIQHREQERGWQVKFLQKQEVDAQQHALGDMVDQRFQIEKIYPELSRSVLALDVDTPSLKYVDQQDPETQRMRAAFLSAPDAGRERLLREGAKEHQQQQLSARRSTPRSSHNASAMGSSHHYHNNDSSHNNNSSAADHHHHHHHHHLPTVSTTPRGGTTSAAARGDGNSRDVLVHASGAGDSQHHSPHQRSSMPVELPQLASKQQHGGSSTSSRPSSQQGAMIPPVPPPRNRSLNR